MNSQLTVKIWRGPNPGINPKDRREVSFGVGSLQQLLITFALCIIFGSSVLSAATLWEFNPQRLGRALVEGGWMADQSLDIINDSPELTFPLQLIYLNTRRESGCFGGQWFCPQLESNVLPKDKGALAWTTPSGNVIGLFSKSKSALEFKDRSGQWQARLAGVELKISSLDGWQYLYRAGHLLSVRSPTGIELAYDYKNTDLTQIVLRDPASGGSRVVFSVIDRQSSSRITKLSISGRIHQFTYGSGRDGKLLSWKRPGAAKPDIFDYDKLGALAAIQPQRGEPVIFKTEFIDPSVRSAADLKTISKYRVIDDGTYKYTYTGSIGKPPEVGGSITIEDKAGGKQSLAFAENGNIQVAKNADGSQSKTVFYRSPGQKSNGKLRRVEQNGKVVIENRYDKETGNLVETTDGNGITTFFEYNPQTVDKPLLSNKPIAIYRSISKGQG